MDAQQTRIYTAIIITSVVIGIILFYFIVSVIRQQRKNVELHRQNILAEITQIEKDRARIAEDLHDDLGPLVAAVKMNINNFELTVERDKIRLEKTNANIEELMRRIKEISFDLMPTSLLRKGILVAIDEYVDYLNAAGTIKFYFTFDEDLKLHEQPSINLYRIVREVLHNTIKHSGASMVNIGLKKIKNNMILTISDNGKGFDYYKAFRENPGLGLKSLMSRTKIMNGKMYIESEKGTTYTFEIPLS